MSVLADTLAEFAEKLDDALEQHSAGIADARAAGKDHQTQLGVMNISLMAVRAEVLGRIDAMEVKVLTKLEAIARQLGTNGSGGGHV